MRSRAPSTPSTEKAICENIVALRGQYTTVAITHRPIWAEIATHLYKVERGNVSKVDPVTGAKATRNLGGKSARNPKKKIGA